MDKLKSRKFWVCVAAALASIGASIAGLTINNEIIVGFGVVCTVISSAIYAFTEAWVDSARISSNTKQTINTTKKEVTE